MSEVERPPEPPAEADKPQKSPGRGDAAAFGIGCLVFLIFFGAIIMVGVLRE